MKGKKWLFEATINEKPSEVGYWKPDEVPESGECLRKKHQFLNFWGKAILGKYGKRAKSKLGEENIKSLKSLTQKGGYYKYVPMHTMGREFEKLLIWLYLHTKWMVPDKCCGIFLCISPAKYTRASLPARKMSLFSSITIKIILSHAIIRIYTILCLLAGL